MSGSASAIGGVERSQAFLAKLRAQLEPFNPLDLLATSGALELVPENAERALRLQAFAQVVASLPIRRALPAISTSRLRRILNGPELSGLAHGEDPFPNAFVEDVPFYEGSYSVFPGTTAGSTYTFRMLSRAVFQHDRLQRAGRLAYPLVLGTLRLSREMCTRAELQRGADPLSRPSEGIIVPASERFRDLKSAVTFTREDMGRFFGEGLINGRPWERLTTLCGSVPYSEYSFEDSPLMLRPIVQAGNTFIVPCPETLLTVLNHHLVSLAIEGADRQAVVEAYCEVASDSVASNMRFMDMTRVRYAFPEDEAIPQTREMLYRFDSDKIAYILILPDTLEDFQPALGSGGLHRTPDLEEKLRRRVRLVENNLYSTLSEVNEMLCLLVIAGVGRAHVCGLGDMTVDAIFQWFPAHELETLTHLEGGNCLALWRFSRESDRIRRTTLVQAWSPLDEFGFYRGRKYSFYATDDAPPNVISLTTDFSGALHREVIAARDWRAVPSYNGKGVTEVTTLHGNRKIPIYIQSSLFAHDVAVFVDEFPFPLWVVSVDPQDGSNPRGFRAEMAASLAYWLWQCSRRLAPFLRNIRTNRPVLIRVSLPNEEEWSIPESAVQSGGVDQVVKISADQAHNSVNIVFRSDIARLFNTADNYGERECLRYTLMGLRELLQIDAILTDQVIMEIIELVAPLGMKKMVFLFDMRRLPELDPRGIPHYRHLQEGDIDDVLQRLGLHLHKTRNLPVGPISDAKRNEILHAAVTLCYSELQKLVRAHRPEGFIEFLILQHEAVVRENTHRKLTIPTRIACFQEVEDVVKKLGEEFPQIARTALASRFLIEYSAAQPPTGLRAVSLSSYDEMMAVAHHIIGFGSLSDAVKYNLSDVKLSMLKSGRLGRNEANYDVARAAHWQEVSSKQIAQSPAYLRRHWPLVQKADATPNELVRALDNASRAEFGFTGTEISEFLAAVSNVGEQMDPGVAVIQRDELIDRLSPLGWPAARIVQALDLFSISPRADYLKPSGDFCKEDVYPWRFNRALSYLRRPLVIRERDSRLEILWGSRHVETARENLFNLCLTGRLKPQSDAMKSFISKHRQKQADKFNDSVADIMRDTLGLRVERRVRKIANFRSENLGDIDVLAADLKKQEIFVVECKDISVARTPHELSSEVTRILYSDEKNSSVVARHEQRVEWARKHIPDIIAFLKLQPSKGWHVKSYILVDEALMTPHLRKCPITVLTLDELKNGLY